MKDIDNKLVENRRSFLKKASMMIGAGIAIPVMGTVISSCEKNETFPPVPPSTVTVDLSKYPALASVDGAAKVVITGKNGGKPLIIVKKSATEFVVMDSTCTHAGCEIDLPAPGNDNMVCGCHSVDFNKLDGKVLKNPLSGWTPIALTKYSNTYNSAANSLSVVI